MILHGDEMVRPASVDKLNMRADRAIIMLQFVDLITVVFIAMKGDVADF